jgi:hypothetical protein
MFLNIWVPAGSNQELIDANFSSYFVLLRKIQPITPITCFNQLLSLVCTAAFQPCHYENITELDRLGCHGFFTALSLVCFSTL